MSAEPVSVAQPQVSEVSKGGRPLTAGAIALMLLLCLSWGFNQIAVKLVLPEIPPFLQGMLRSCGALVVILLIAWFRGVKLFSRDGTLKAGLFCGLLFGIEFVLIYRGLLLTSASRAVVFLYTAPFLWRSVPIDFLASDCVRSSGAGWPCVSQAWRWRSACRSLMSMQEFCSAIS